MTHRSRLAQIILDCRTEDLDAATSFWSAALGRETRPLDDPEDERYRALETHAGELNILLQRVDHASRVHLDIETDDVEAEVSRLVTLGAKRIAQVRTWWIMEAPTGHRFCVLRPQLPGLADQGNTW
jgi:predicted enzyme related to lactoylglutathione lyase